MAHVFAIQLGILGRADGSLRVYRDAEASSGLTSARPVDWPARARALLDQWRPRMVVLVFGANDALDLREDRRVYRLGGAEWERRYGARVAAMLDIASGDGRQVLWVGMPVMRSAVFSARMRAINAIVREQIRGRSRVSYVDAWQRFQGAEGLFSERLSDAEGRSLVVRERDGVHYTRDGAERLTARVLSLLPRACGESPPR